MGKWSEAQKRYAHSEKGKLARKKYQSSEKAKLARQRYIAKRKVKLAEMKQKQVETANQVESEPKVDKIKKEARLKK